MTVNGRTGLVAQTILTASSNSPSSLQGIATGSLEEGASCFVQENDGTYVLFPASAAVPDNVNVVAATGGGNWVLQAVSGQGAVLTVDNIAAMVGVLSSDLVWVSSLQVLWHRNPASTLTPDGITVVAATAGGNWERIDATSSPEWQAQTTWYIDPSDGDDENDGALANPLATLAEVQRRWGPRPHLTVAVTINVLQDDIDEDTMLRADVSGDGVVILIGQATALVSAATIATDQPWDYATGANGQDAQVTSGDVADWSLYTANSGSTSGAARIFRPADGAIGFVLDTTGGVGTARPTRMGQLTMFSGPGMTMSDLVTTDIVNIERMPTIKSLLVDIERIDSVPGSGAVAAIIENFRIHDATSGLARITVKSPASTESTSGVVFVGCILSGSVYGINSKATFLGCVLRGLENMVGSMTGGGSNQGFDVVNSQIRISDIFAATAALTRVRNNSYLYAVGGQLALFDSASDGLFIDTSSQALVDEIFGSGNGGFGVVCNGWMYYQVANTPKTTGTSGDNQIGGATIANGALPSITVANQAMIVVEP